MAEFIVIDFVGNLNKTLMGLDGQLVRLATKMNFHSPLNYNATCTLMLPKSKLIFLYRKQNKSSGEKHHQDKDENGLQELVVQKLDSAIHRKNHYPRDSAILVSLILIRRIVIYLMDTAIHVLNNRACSLNLIL